MFSQIKDTKHIRRNFHYVAWVMPQGWDFGALGVPRWSTKKLFFKHGHVAYQIHKDDEQNRMQVKFSSLGQTGDLGVRSNGQLSLTCQFQRFLYQTLRVFSQIKKIEKILNRIFILILLSGSCPVVGLVGGGGESKTLAWGFAMAPHRLRALVIILGSKMLLI